MKVSKPVRGLGVKRTASPSCGLKPSTHEAQYKCCLKCGVWLWPDERTEGYCMYEKEFKAV